MPEPLRRFRPPAHRSLLTPITAVLALLCVAILAACSGPPTDGEIEAVAQELRDRAQKEHGALELVRSLTYEVGPRLAGSPGDAAGVAWAARTLKELGFENVRAERVAVPHWVRGEEWGAIVAPFPQPLHLTALGGSVGTPDGGLEAEVVGAASLDALAALPEEAVRGKIVFVHQRMERKREGAGYGAAVPVRYATANLAAKKGAVGALIRSVGTGPHRFPHTGSMRYDEDVPRIPIAALAHPDADALEHQLARGQEVRVRYFLGAHYLDDSISANVIGEIPGSEIPEEIVLLGAHLDSWDLGTGAIDDGVGCAIVLEAARLAGALRPRRTLRVVLFANEEFGLSGARTYAEAHAGELDRHILAFESDLGADRVWRFAARVDPNAVERLEPVANLLAPLGIEWQGNTGRGGPDLSPLRQARVPMADLTQSASTYFDYHHTADDTVDKIDPEALSQNVAAYATLAYYAAQVEEGFGRAEAVEEGEGRRR
jgi:hypothetical protein